MLLSLIKKSFSQITENSSIILFVVSYMILVSVIAPLATTNFLMKTLGICLILLTVVFCSGWLQLINEVVLDKEIHKKSVFAIFLEGIGKNIVPVIIAMGLYLLILILDLYLTGLVANHFFGDINAIFKDIFASAGENNNLIEIFRALPTEKQYTLYGWQFCLIVGTFILGFLFLFYFPFLINCKNNICIRPFDALWQSLKFTFKNFLSILGLYVLMNVIYILIGILRALSSSNMVASIVMLFVYIYFLAGVVVLIFNYYEAKNNSTDGSDSIGEDKALDTAGKED